MIISVRLENWMSFRDETCFSMVASRERQHGKRVPRIAKYQARVLPIAALYGGNASGKSNFFQALWFARHLIVDGTKPDKLIPVDPFRLDAESTRKPSRFCFELLIDEVIYEYSFAVTRREVVEEKLVEITSTRERVLYHRREGKPNFDKGLENDQFLRFAFQGTRDNQLFLTNSVSQKVDKFRPVYDWFKNKLNMIAPDSRYAPFEQFLDERHPLYSKMNRMLERLDTGIVRLGGVEIPIESLPLPEPLKDDLRENVEEGETTQLIHEPIGMRIVVTRRNGKLIAKKLVAFHSRADGSEAEFEMQQESDGSKRILDLLPAFVELLDMDSKGVFVIDEIDRSLHTLLTRQLLSAYLANCSPSSRTQLLFTTHDLFLMDQGLLRRDEMWRTERDADGVSSLVSFSEYEGIRYDKDIRKSYLQGRFGGTPRIAPGIDLPRTCIADDSETDD